MRASNEVPIHRLPSRNEPALRGLHCQWAALAILNGYANRAASEGESFRGQADLR